MSAVRGEFWPSDLSALRIAPVRAAYAEAAGLVYAREAPGADFWQTAAETRRLKAGDCEDITEVFLARMLRRTGLAGEEALRLAIVDSGTRPLEPLVQLVDEWGEVMVPGIDHACCLWLPEVSPGLSSVAYGARWRSAREYVIDSTWKVVAPWSDVGFRLVWSWGIEGGFGVWRKHFEKVPAA